MKCGKKGHFAKYCQSRGAGTSAKSRKVAKPPRRLQRIDERDESSNDIDSVVEDDKVVLATHGDENGQNIMTGKRNGNPFRTMVDSASPVTSFEIDDIKEIMKQKTLFIRELPNNEDYVDFHRQKLNLLGYVFSQLEVGNSKLQKARILVAEKRAKSRIGRDWLNASNYKFVLPIRKKVKMLITELLRNWNTQIKQTIQVKWKKSKMDRQHDNNELIKLKEQYEELFTRQGRLIDHEVRTEFEQIAKVSQQKKRRIPIQLQEAVEEETGRLLKEGHIEKVREVTDKGFINPSR